MIMLRSDNARWLFFLEVMHPLKSELHWPCGPVRPLDLAEATAPLQHWCRTFFQPSCSFCFKTVVETTHEWQGPQGPQGHIQWGSMGLTFADVLRLILFGEVTSAESGLQGAQLTHFAEGVNGCKWIDVNGGFRRSMHVAEWWMVQPGALPNDQNVGRLARFVLAPCSRRWRITGCLVREPRTQPLKDMMTWELLKRLRWSVSHTCTNSIQKLGAKAF